MNKFYQGVTSPLLCALNGGLACWMLQKQDVFPYGTDHKALPRSRPSRDDQYEGRFSMPEVKGGDGNDDGVQGLQADRRRAAAAN